MAGAIEPGGRIRELRGAHQERPTDHPLPVRPRRADYRLEGECAGSESLAVDAHREGQAGRDRRSRRRARSGRLHLPRRLRRCGVDANRQQRWSAEFFRRDLAACQGAGDRSDGRPAPGTSDRRQGGHRRGGPRPGAADLARRQCREAIADFAPARGSRAGFRCEDHRPGSVRRRRGAGGSPCRAGATRRLSARPTCPAAGGATLPGAIPSPPPPPPETNTRKITVFRSVKSEQYDVPQELQ